MSIRESTKYAFANVLKQLLTTKDLQKIRVTELCERYGAECPTFYYHFRDKYDLIAWSYTKDFEQSVKDNGGIYNQRRTTLQMYRMLEQKAFYRKVFAEQTQNALSNYIIQYNRQSTEYLVKKRLNTDALSKEMRFSIQFYVRAWVSSMVEWIMEPENLSAEDFVALVYADLPSYMTDTYVDELPLGSQ